MRGRRWARAAIGGGVLVALLAGSATSAGSAGASGTGPAAASPRRVVIVSIPRLGWDDVVPADMPALTSVADSGAVGALSVRAIGRHTGPAEGYATLGAGNRAQAPDDERSSIQAGLAEDGSGQTYDEVLEAEGRHPTTREVLPGIAEIQAANAHTHQGAVVGALGRALHRANFATQALLDPSGWATGSGPAGLALVDPDGSVGIGRIARPVPGPPGTFSLSPDDVHTTIDGLPKAASVSLIEIGDVARADAAHLDRADRQAAARAADTALAAVVDNLDLTKDLVVVLAPVGPSPQPQPTPIVVAGPGIGSGLLRSATTRRAGYVTLTDVAPAILDWLQITVPPSMTGTPIEVTPDGRSGFDRVAAVRTAIAETRFVDRSQGKLMSTLPIVFGSWSLLLLLAATLPLGALRRPARAFLRWLALVIAASPGVSFALAACSTRGWGQPAWFAVLYLGSIAVASGAAHLARPFPEDPWLAPALVAAATWLLLLGDLASGGRLQFDAALGNSPTVAGRFSGVGNLAFAVFAASAIVLATLAVVGFRRTSAPTWAGPLAAAAILATTIVLDGAPGLGSDVGGVLALVPSSFVCWWLATGRRIDWRPVAAGLAATALAIGGFGLYDLSRPAADRTHLGRLLGGDTQARETVIRKALSAIDSTYHSSLVWILVASAGLALAAWLVRRPTVLARFAPRTTARSLAASALVLGLLGGALNDSGVAVPAMMAMVLVPFAVYTLFRPEPDPLATPRPGDQQGGPAAPSSDPAVSGSVTA